ncbi:hypothetical protein AALA44_05555 [Enterococcus ratti]
MTKKIYLMGAVIGILGAMLAVGKSTSFAEEVKNKNSMNTQEKTTNETAESTLENWEMGQQSYEEDVKEEREYFQKKYGYEDKFYTLDNEDQLVSDVEGKEKLKEEFNPVSGVLRITNLDTGEVEEQNHYEDIKPVEGATPEFN